MLGGLALVAPVGLRNVAHHGPIFVLTRSSRRMIFFSLAPGARILSFTRTPWLVDDPSTHSTVSSMWCSPASTRRQCGKSHGRLVPENRYSTRSPLAVSPSSGSGQCVVASPAVSLAGALRCIAGCLAKQSTQTYATWHLAPFLQPVWSCSRSRWA